MRNEDAFNLNAKKWIKESKKNSHRSWQTMGLYSVLHLIIFSGEKYFTFRHICNFDSWRRRSRAVERLLAIQHRCLSAAGHSQNCAETGYCWCCCCRYYRNTGHGLQAANYVVSFIVRKQHNDENGQKTRRKLFDDLIKALIAMVQVHCFRLRAK